jgi:hypothetical protein
VDTHKVEETQEPERRQGCDEQAARHEEDEAHGIRPAITTALAQVGLTLCHVPILRLESTRRPFLAERPRAASLLSSSSAGCIALRQSGYSVCND